MTENKHILILAGSFYPNFSAVGICAGNIAEELALNSKVTVICQKTDYAQTPRDKYGKCDIIRVSTSRQDRFLKNREKFSTAGGAAKQIASLKIKFNRLERYALAILRRSNINRDWIDSYLAAMEQAASECPVDMVVSFCFPFESVVAGTMFKERHPGTRFIPFLMDRFASSTSLHRIPLNRKIKFARHRNIEANVFGSADKVLFLDSWHKDILSHSNELEFKKVRCEHPLLKRLSVQKKTEYDTGKINLVYTGALIKNVRDPLYTLQVLGELIKMNDNIVVHFYIVGDCKELVDQYSEMFPDNIINHGSVATGVAHSAILSANLLLSVGNSDINQFPSKTFEYMSSGKPIIHFSKNNNDPVNGILDRYGFSAIIAEQDKNPNDTELLEYLDCFIIENQNQTLNFEEVSEKFPEALPSTIAMEILS